MGNNKAEIEIGPTISGKISLTIIEGLERKTVIVSVETAKHMVERLIESMRIVTLNKYYEDVSWKSDI